MTQTKPLLGVQHISVDVLVVPSRDAIVPPLIDSRRKRERVWAGLYLHNFLVKTVSTATHARDLTIAPRVASLFRRVEPACNTEMH